MSKFSLEIVPKQLERLTNLPENQFGDVYVAFIPGDNHENIARASESILDMGYNPIPHIPARSITSEKELDVFLVNLKSAGVNDILAIGGSPKKQEGPFEKTMDTFHTGIIQKYGFREVNIAGHPEGNPDDLDTDNSVLEKASWLRKNNIKFSIVTQWTLDVPKTNDWIIKTKEIIKEKLDYNVTLKIGVAGPAKLTTLINYAKICGVSATTLIVKNKKFGLTKLIKHNPTEIIKGLKHFDQLHFFPFGGIKELTNWIEKREENNVRI